MLSRHGHALAVVSILLFIVAGQVSTKGAMERRNHAAARAAMTAMFVATPSINSVVLPLMLLALDQKMRKRVRKAVQECWG